MIRHPKPGQIVRLWYAERARQIMPHHGRYGTVVTAAKGTPRNHMVRVGGEVVTVPAGNLQPVETHRGVIIETLRVRRGAYIAKALGYRTGRTGEFVERVEYDARTVIGEYPTAEAAADIARAMIDLMLDKPPRLAPVRDQSRNNLWTRHCEALRKQRAQTPAAPVAGEVG